MKRLAIAVIAGLVALAAPAVAAPPQSIGNAKFRVEVPSNWNGTLLLYSHGYYPVGIAPDETLLANRLYDTPEWLLRNGFALAASDFEGLHGLAIEPAVRDQIALLDWFEANVGKPRRTIATGTSMGGGIAAQLAERNPGRFQGVLAMCGEYDPQSTWNTALDVTFTVKTLLAEGQDIDLVKARNPAASSEALQQAVLGAQDDKGRARIALAAAIGNIPGWYNPHEPEPTDKIADQAKWIYGAYVWGMGPAGGREDLERRAGGNPSFNVGVDYRRLLGKSYLRNEVEKAYRAAGLNLDEDLDKLAKAPRIAPDPQAVAYMYRYTVASGRMPVPIVTLHSTRDGGAVSDQVRWYADEIDRPDRIKQLYVARGGHCGFSAAEELTALKTLLHKIDRGHWPDTSPAKLNIEAGEYGSAYQNVLFLDTFGDKEMAPAFTRFTPPKPLRPSH
ncbi:tannase/feruloyl esterase family alpha/beta hydrolase [Kibdelosporangium philippinense]|uniref:Tannase/feruloyl esterase family alpha/beta hydrolase n=1 Tax=Kibdelosporangium philippinense TaxID=211113 RepID=A0ABS8ZKK1_9PSEU|nr:alpha/beta fold hydrolase [Kibdelosporangium philippinense]MCE7008333.1 tannase/feruloyl esterase family alpha/beta hydrolase [Kibdelosporangium philippinense]